MKSTSKVVGLDCVCVGAKKVLSAAIRCQVVEITTVLGDLINVKIIIFFFISNSIDYHLDPPGPCNSIVIGSKIEVENVAVSC